jgi:hypothetical protein
VRKPDEPPFAQGGSAVQVAAPGQNYKNRTVTLRGPQQKTVTLKVDKDVKKFNEVTKGDEIVVKHTEALAINVQPTK